MNPEVAEHAAIVAAKRRARANRRPCRAGLAPLTSVVAGLTRESAALTRHVPGCHPQSRALRARHRRVAPAMALSLIRKAGCLAPEYP